MRSALLGESKPISDSRVDVLDRIEGPFNLPEHDAAVL